MSGDDQEGVREDAGKNGENDAEDAPQDASFSDSFKPLRLAARDPEDLKILSALLQDAVVRIGDMAYLPDQNRFAMVLNRYRWEEKSIAERVRAGAHFDGVLSARIKGFNPSVKEQPLSILEVRFEPSADDAEGLAGKVRVVFAGEAEVALEVEAIDAAMSDIGRPCRAVGKPIHGGAD